MLLCTLLLSTLSWGPQENPAASPPIYPEAPAGLPAPVPVENADATGELEMKPYAEPIPGSAVTIEMVPIPAGTFVMGSPAGEKRRKKDESPQHEVALGAFWIGKHELTWDAYHVFMFRLDQELRSAGEAETLPQDSWADAVSRPTPPYVPMDFGMGIAGHPAVCMTQFGARQYSKWLSMKTGRFYRLPTEAEWEYACRAGTTSAYSFGNDEDELDEYAWYFDNADDQYQPVGLKKPNPWGLYDMHGNVAEWVLDGYQEDFYERSAKAGQPVSAPLCAPTELYPRVVRGGSWDDDPDRLRSAARGKSTKSWKVQDPQLPKSIWFHTDAPFVGFRLVRPLAEPSDEERARAWDPDLDSVREIMEKQRRGDR